MNDLALIAIGCGFGIALALVAVLACTLVWSSYKQREATRIAQKYLTHLIEQNTLAIDKLRGEVSLSLSRMDAERLYAASLTIQRTSRSLAEQVDTLQRALYSSPATSARPAIDFSAQPEAFDLNDEALDDQRLVQERSRWQGAHSQQPPPASPLDLLSEEEKAARVQEFFAQRRNGVQAAGAGTNFGYPSSTPPTAGSGVYASLVEQVQATQPFVPRAAPADFDDAGGGMGVEVDLTEKGELG